MKDLGSRNDIHNSRTTTFSLCGLTLESNCFKSNHTSESVLVGMGYPPTLCFSKSHVLNENYLYPSNCLTFLWKGRSIAKPILLWNNILTKYFTRLYLTDMV